MSNILGGSVTIGSSNPLADPIIDPNFYASPLDLFVAREAIRSGQRFVQASAWRGFVVAPLLNLTSDADLDQYIRDTSITAFHPVGTAAMSPKHANYGVVDPDLLVKGLRGLRIVDASVLVSIFQPAYCKPMLTQNYTTALRPRCSYPGRCLHICRKGC